MIKFLIFPQVLVDVHADPNLLVAYGNQPFLHFITSFLCISMGFFFLFRIWNWIDNCPVSNNFHLLGWNWKTIVLSCSCWGKFSSPWKTRYGEINSWLKSMKPTQSSWLDFVYFVLDHLQGRFDHPYVSFLFYGADTAGDFIPIKQLREKYNRPRHEVPTDSPDEDS